MIELLHLCARSDAGTLFEDLKVLDFRTDKDLSLDNVQALERVVAAVPLKPISKADGSADQRFNGWWDHERLKLWPLQKFVGVLERIALEGDITDTSHEWMEESERPAQCDGAQVYLLDWPYRPLYVLGGFPDFLSNLCDLKGELQAIERGSV